MRFFYQIGIHFFILFLRIFSVFNPKIRTGLEGRKNWTSALDDVPNNANVMWFHCASLGEFDQGLPVMHALKNKTPNAYILVTFFSPSGMQHFEKRMHPVDKALYLPFDTKLNAKIFIQKTNPTLAIFVKYEFWPNYLVELKRQNIKTLLISGVFREDQLFFKFYGGFMRKALDSFDHFFLQNQASKELLASIGLTNTSVSGDTRFDRVSRQIEMDNTLDFIAQFKKEHLCIVCGSTWEEDQDLLLEYINQAPEQVKFIIAPHIIDAPKILALRKKIHKQTAIYSQTIAKGNIDNIETAQVFIIDTIGLLAKIYSYADIVYVGGAAGTKGLHNILEPATFGVPIVIGKNYDNFPEAIKLRSLAGLFSAENSTECKNILSKLVEDSSFRNKTGMICGHFVDSNTGATKKIAAYLKK